MPTLPSQTVLQGVTVKTCSATGNDKVGIVITLHFQLIATVGIATITEWQSWHHDKLRVHDDVIKWKHFPRYWPYVRGIHRSPVNSPHKGQWRGALMFSLICARINGWVNNGEAGDLRRYRAHYDVTVMFAVPHSSILHFMLDYVSFCVCTCPVK